MKDQGIAVPAETDPVARAEIYSTFKNSGTDTRNAGEVPLHYPYERRRSPGCCLIAKPIAPFA